jgi:hypothetical protein
MFAPSFLAQVPAPKLTEIFSDYFSKLGRCTQAKQTASLSAYAGRFDFIFEKGSSVSATLAIDSDEPRLLNGLLLGIPIRNSATLDEVVSELKTLPGETSLLITRLGKDGSRPILAYNADREMAIGSAFKLYILIELVREVGARERKWTDVVPLDGKMLSLALGHVAIMARELARHAAHAGQYDDLDQRQYSGRRVTHDSGPRASGSYPARDRSH